MVQNDLIIVTKLSGSYLDNSLRVDGYRKVANQQKKYPNLDMLGDPVNFEREIENLIMKRKQKKQLSSVFDIDVDDEELERYHQMSTAPSTVTRASTPEPAPALTPPPRPVSPLSELHTPPPRALSLSPHLEPDSSPYLPANQGSPNTPFVFDIDPVPPSASYWEERHRDIVEFTRFEFEDIN